MSQPHRATSANGAPGEAAKWNAVQMRDQAYDGVFYYSVVTTGIYCRPSCPARRPNRKNIRFYPTREAAEWAGFRACKRCRPDAIKRLGSAHIEKITAACRIIETAETQPKLAELAASLGVSPFHFHRAFKSATGVTPQAYAAAHRQKRARRALASNATIANAIYDAGYGSSARFYENATDILGMTPTRFRKGGEGAKIRFAVGQCALGAILVAASEVGVTAILLGDEPEPLVHDLERLFPKADLIGADRTFENLVARVVGLVEHPERDPNIPLDIQGTAFQHRVWEALRRIPPGKTVSYTDIARRIGKPQAARAVAQACAANTLAVAIPCHRVVRENGDLSGYRWGIDRKRALIDREAKARRAKTR